MSGLFDMNLKMAAINRREKGRGQQPDIDTPSSPHCTLKWTFLLTGPDASGRSQNRLWRVSSRMWWIDNYNPRLAVSELHHQAG